MQTKNYYLSSVVETSSIPPDITSAEKRSELLKCKYMSVAAIFPYYDNSNHVFFFMYNYFIFVHNRWHSAHFRPKDGPQTHLP